MVDGRRARKKHEVRARLLEAARRLFAEAPVESVSVDAIAEAADVARTTFFNHFASKGALLDELAGQMRARQLHALATLRAEGAPLEVALDGWFGRVATSIRRSPALSQVLLSRAFGGGDEPGARADAMAEVHAAYAAWLTEAAARGEVAAGLDVRFAAEMVSGVTTALISNWINDPRYPLESRALQAAEFLHRALAPAPSEPAARRTRRRGAR